MTTGETIPGEGERPLQNLFVVQSIRLKPLPVSLLERQRVSASSAGSFPCVTFCSEQFDGENRGFLGSSISACVDFGVDCVKGLLGFGV
eukprot:511542-Amphidinium_carterae.2